VNKKNKIKFSPSLQNPESLSYQNPPVESSRVIPDWYKDLSGFKNSSSTNIRFLNPVNDRGQDGSDVSTKLCPPYLDAIISGYMHTAPEDIFVEILEEEKPIISWKSNEHLIDTRPKVDVPIPKECYPVQFGWKMTWYYETPPGYSLLFTHPLNRYDLPFYNASAIVDSDIWGLPAFMPFFLKRGFSGVIPKGTPLFQMIPIKRDDWELDIDMSDEKYWKNKEREEKRRTDITGHYKKTTWQKKQY
jgi:hypothetical protein